MAVLLPVIATDRKLILLWIAPNRRVAQNMPVYRFDGSANINSICYHLLLCCASPFVSLLFPVQLVWFWFWLWICTYTSTIGTRVFASVSCAVREKELVYQYKCCSVLCRRKPCSKSVDKTGNTYKRYRDRNIFVVVPLLQSRLLFVFMKWVVYIFIVVALYR